MDTRSKESRSLQVSCPVYCATRLCRHHRCRLYRHHRRCHECRCHLPRVQSDMRHLPTWAAPRYHRYPCQRLQPGCSSRPGKWAVWRNHRSRFSKHRPRIACGLSPHMAALDAQPFYAAVRHRMRMPVERCPSAVTPHNPAVSCCARCARGAGSKRPAHCWTRGDADRSGRPSFLGLR